MFKHKGSRVIFNKWDQNIFVKEMEKVGVTQEGIEIMKKKNSLCLKIKDVSPEAAIIIKQEALARGCEAAVNKDVLTKRKEHTDLLLWGKETNLNLLLEKLSSQPFSLKEITQDLNKIMKNVKIKSWKLRAGEKEIDFGVFPEEPLIMGVLNVTPDSFSNGGRYLKKEEAVAHGIKMVEEGAQIIDVGGESSRPFAAPVPPETEKRRVLPVIKELSEIVEVPISIDSYHAEVVEEALQAGATIINDITGLSSEKMVKLSAENEVPVVLMHMKGTPRDMQLDPFYKDVIEEIYIFFEERMERALKLGVEERQIIVDPGIGFGKTVEHNLTILNRLYEFSSLGRPILVGTSRKSFIGNVLGLDVNDRLEGSLASVVVARVRGASIFRVHDVKETRRALKLADAILKAI
ncbi:MAG TPA: dihydropteroate synthase [Thermoplasmata archaeon]|nr:dihydropteroate synthase [Thermoplasmata archaeon]